MTAVLTLFYEIIIHHCAIIAPQHLCSRLVRVYTTDVEVMTAKIKHAAIRRIFIKMCLSDLHKNIIHNK